MSPISRQKTGSPRRRRSGRPLGWAFTAVFVLGCNLGSPPPRLAVEPVLHLGQGSPGEELTGKVTLKNEGPGVLHINQLDPGCGCSAVRVTRASIPAGEQAELLVAARIKADGKPLSFPVRIFSNDPASPETVILVSADIAAPPLRTEPETVDFGEVAVCTSPVQVVRLRKADGSPWPAGDAVTVKAADGRVACQIRRADHLSVEVRPRSDLPLGQFSDTLTLTPEGTSRTVQVAVKGVVVPRIVVSPTALFFGDVDVQAGIMKRSFVLRRTDGQKLAKVVRSSGPAGLRLEEGKEKPAAASGHQRRLQVSLDPAAVKEDTKDGKLLLWLENEPEPVTVRVMIFLSRKVAAKGP